MRRPPRATTLSLAVWMTLLAWAPAAEAQAPSPTPASTPAKASAEDLLKRFAEAAKANDWPRAYEAMQEASSQRQTYDVLLNLGTAELRLGKMRDAAEHLSRSLALFPATGKPEAKKMAEESFAKAAAQVGTLRLTVSPAEARVLVGSRTYGVDDYREQVFVEAGEVMVSAGDVAGYASEQKTVHVDKGKTVDVEIALTLANGAASATATGTVAPATTTTGAAPNVPLVIAGGAVTLASLGVGIGLLVASSDKKAEADKIRQGLLDKKVFGICESDQSDPDCQRFADAGNARTLFGNVGASLLVAAGVVAVSTGVYYLVARPKSPAPPVQTGVVVSANGGAFSVQGKF